MYKDRRPSDYEFILGSFFVVCILFGVNLLGSQTERHIVVNPTMLVSAVPAAAGTPAPTATGAAAPSSQAQKDAQSCMKEIQNTKTNYGKDYECLPGCTYTVKIGKTGGSFFERNFSNMVEVIPSGKPSQSIDPPGQVKYIAMFGIEKGPFACKDTVVGTAQNKIPDLRNISFAFQAGTPAVGEPINLVPKWDTQKSQMPLSNVPSYGADLKSTADANKKNYEHFGLEPLTPPGTLPEIPSTDLPAALPANATYMDPNSAGSQTFCGTTNCILPDGIVVPKDFAEGSIAQVVNVSSAGQERVYCGSSGQCLLPDGTTVPRSFVQEAFQPNQITQIGPIGTPAVASPNPTTPGPTPVDSNSDRSWWDRILGKGCFFFYCQ